MIDVEKLRKLKGMLKVRRIYQFYLDEETGEITDVTSRDDIMIVRYGHWEDCSNGWMCSECKRDSQKETNYCPYCGAKMERWIQRGKKNDKRGTDDSLRYLCRFHRLHMRLHEG